MCSKITYILSISLILSIALFLLPKWEDKGTETSLAWDASTYYWYLPATFIYHDLKEQKFSDSILRKYEFTPTFVQAFVHKSGNRVLTYSSGLAVVCLPAFFVAHAIAEPLGYPADGFSKPYQVAMQLNGILVVIIGLWYFRKLLLLYFNDKVVAVLLLMLVFGTNYLNYASRDVTITHSYLFTIYVLLLLNTHNFYKDPGIKYAAGIGTLLGLAILIRPSEMVAVLIPLLWNMEGISLKAIRAKAHFVGRNIKYIGVAAFCCMAIGSIQIIYWLYITGQPFVYSYHDKGFSWLSPYTWKYLVSYRSGWIIYNPIVLFILIGIIPFIKYGKNKVAILVFFVVNLYVISSWDVWWYSGFGGRAMIQSYAAIFFPAGYLFEYIRKKKWLVYITGPVFALFTYVNLWLMYNAHTAGGLYDTEGMTCSYYWAVIGRWNVSKETLKLKDTYEIFTGTPQNMKLLHREDFEGDSVYCPVPAISGNKSVYIDAGHIYSPKVSIPFEKDEADWIRAEATIKAIENEFIHWKMIQLIVEFSRKGEASFYSRRIRINRFMNRGETRQIYIDVPTPEEKFDTIHVFFWNPGSDYPIVADNILIWSFDE